MFPVLRSTTLRGPGLGLRRLVYVTVTAMLVAISACASTTPSEPSALEISTQPASQYVSPGRTATLTVGVAAMTTPKYQWYIGSSGTTTTPIPGAKSNSYTTPALLTTTSYWVRVTDGSEIADSATAALDIVDRANVGLAPGTAFGAGGEAFFRLCFNRRLDEVEEASKRIAAWIATV